ncbi:MAG TPA: hotdog domain-containing protein [Kineosporiaceae bacterium]|nr:hotdog domain-containing protein [Kineosporiaceae bacterium]
MSERSDDGAEPGRAVLVFEVTEADTAGALGSGDVEVLATPRLLAWCEAATCRAAADRLDPGRTSVGTRVALEHLLATPVGGRVEVEARLLAADGRLLRFEVRAVDRHGAVVGAGEVTRVIVDRDRFAARTPAP